MTMTEVAREDDERRLRPAGDAARGVLVRVLCPCWVGEDPDGGSCDAFNAYHFDAGTIRGVDVSGLSLVKVVRIPGNVLAPNSWRQVIFVDDRASKEQAEALIEAYQGDLGGPLADLAGLVGETLAIERATIVHEVSDGEGTLRVGDVVTSQLGPLPRARWFGDDAARTRSSPRSPGRRHGWARPRRTPSTCRSTGWCGPSRTATRSRPTTACRTRRTWPDVDDTSDGPPASRRRSRGDRGGVGRRRDRASLREGRAPASRRLDRGPPAAVGGPRSVPARVAGHDRRDDAPLDPADGSPVRGGLDLAGATGRDPGGVPGRIPRGVDGVRSARVRGRHGVAPPGGCHAVARRAPLADRRFGALARRRLPVLRGQGPVPLGMPASRRLPPRALPARRGGGVPARAGTRAVLPGLLLGADAADVRGGCGQPVVDGGADRGDGVREGWTARGPG